MKLKATMLDEYNSATNGSSAKSNLTNFIHVIQVFSEYIIEPDVVEIIIMIRSAKPSVEEVKLSVNKRKDYIVSVAQQNKLIYRVNEDFVTSHDKNYKVECQVTLTLSNYKKAQVLSNSYLK